jgi:hypothetical protein
MDRGRMWERRGGYERVEVRRGEVRKRTDVPLHPSLVQNPRAIEHPGTASRKAVQSY